MSDTIAVIGQTRSGTSLVCQMLAAAGLKVAGEAPGYEDQRSFTLEDAHTHWWDEFDAVKFVDVHTGETPFREALFPRRIVCVRRSVVEQSKSFAKFCEACGIPPMDNRQVRKSIRKLRPWYIGRAKVDKGLKLVFEDILADPMQVAVQVVNFIGRGDPGKVASVVVRRGPECYPGMLEMALIAEMEKGDMTQ